MSVSLYLGLLTVLRIQLVRSLLATPPKIDCNDGGFYIRADPANCSNFYKCDHGSPVLFNCPSGLYFNPAIHVCDWPRNVACNINSGASQQSNIAGQQYSPGNGGQQYNGNNKSPYTDQQSSPHNNAGQQSNGNNDEQYNSVDGGSQYSGYGKPSGGNQYGDDSTNYNQGQNVLNQADSDLLYPVQPVQQLPSDTSVGPSVQEPHGPLDRPRPTIDQLVEANGNPYHDYLNQNQNIDVR